MAELQVGADRKGRANLSISGTKKRKYLKIENLFKLRIVGFPFHLGLLCIRPVKRKNVKLVHLCNHPLDLDSKASEDQSWERPDLEGPSKETAA